NVGGQALIEVEVLGGDAQVPELNLAMGPGQLESPVHAVKVVILIRKGEGMLPAFGDRRGISDCDRCAGAHLKAASQAEDGIEHRTSRAGKRRAALERAGIGRRSTASEEAGAVGLVLHDARGSSIDGQDMDGPDWLLLDGA